MSAQGTTWKSLENILKRITSSKIRAASSDDSVVKCQLASELWVILKTAVVTCPVPFYVVSRDLPNGWHVLYIVRKLLHCESVCSALITVSSSSAAASGE